MAEKPKNGQLRKKKKPIAAPKSKTKKKPKKRLHNPMKFRFKALDKKFYTLTRKEKLFVEVYVGGVTGTRAAIVAYDITNKDLLEKPKDSLSSDQIIKRDAAYATARDMGSGNLAKPHILKYLGFLLSKEGVKDSVVDMQHFKVINQGDDLSAKNKAIDMYYKVTGRYKDTHEFIPGEGWDKVFAETQKILNGKNKK